MHRPISEIIAAFKEFTLEGNYLSALSQLTDELLTTNNPELGLDAMFSLLERYPDEEIGSPGPLIHAIEKCKGDEIKLCASIRRRPSTLAIWALYRLIEKDPQPLFIDVLKEAENNQEASEQIREDAALLLSWVQGIQKE